MFAMNTQACLQVYDYFEKDGVSDDGLIQKFNDLHAEVESLLVRLENELSVNIPTSYISRFNSAAPGEKISVSEDVYRVLTITKRLNELTEGYYNPAVYYSVRAYGFNGGSGAPPQSAEELPSGSAVREYTRLAEHFPQLGLEESGGGYFAVKPTFTVAVGPEILSMKLDLGGVVKGYAADRVNELIEKYGFGYANFNFGSSSMVFKKYPSESGGAQLQFTNPRRRVGDNGYIDPPTYLSCTIQDESVSSSGDFENYFMLDADGDGKEERYCHIFDPATGRPIQTGIMSATVIGGSAAENDGLTTAIMAMGPEKAKQFAKMLNGRKVTFTYSGGERLNLFTTMDEDEYTVLDLRYVGGENSGWSRPTALPAETLACIVMLSLIAVALIIVLLFRVIKSKKNKRESDVARQD